jgi:hypothetical protein
MSYFSRAATTIWLWICWFGVMLFLVCASLLVSPALAVWFSLDFIPKRRSKPLTSQAPQPPKPRHPYHNRPHFVQEGSTVSIEMPDGQVIALEPLSASLMVKEGVECLAAAYVFEQTRIKTDAD